MSTRTRRGAWIGCAIVFAIAVAALLHAQSPRDTPKLPSANPLTAAIRGRVVAAATGDPVRNARVSATGEHELPPLLTDKDGRFAFERLPAGDFTLAASKPGYAKTTFGVRNPDAAGRAIHLDAGAVVDDVVLALARGAAVTGTVTDDTGEPVAGASVLIERVAIRAGTLPTPAVALTDERGEYRAGSLPEGRVRVSVFVAAREVVMMPNGDAVMNGGGAEDRIYYPGGLKADEGEPIDMQRGEEKRGIDFVVPAHAPRVPPLGPPPRDRAAIGGHIVAADGRAVSGAQVVLIPTGRTDVVARYAITDATGAYRFVLPQETGGTFRIGALRRGYLRMAFGQRSPTDPGDEIAVGIGEVRDDIDIMLPRPATISGTLFDENGDPIEGATIRVVGVHSADGRRRLSWAVLPGSRPTDDLGRYRISGVGPADYLLVAIVGQITGIEVSADLPGYATTFFPGTPNVAEGQVVSVGGADVSGVDFSLVRTKTARVSGRAFDASGDPITGGIALMPSLRSARVLPSTIGARIERDGTFEFSNVAPGEYVLQAQRHRNGRWNEGDSWTQYVTVVDADVTDLEIRTTAGSRMTGRVVIEGGGAIKPSQLELSPMPVDDLAPRFGGPPAVALVGDDLTFELAGLRGPRRLQLLRTPPGFALEAVRKDGADITDTVLPFGRADQSLDGVEVVLTNQVSEITGIVTDRRGRPNDRAAVFVFAVDDSTWYPRSRFVAMTTADREGRYRIEGLPAGDYYATPVARASVDVDVGRDADARDFLESLTAAAVRVTIGAAGRIVLPLKLPDR